jgi:hypothetical protein
MHWARAAASLIRIARGVADLAERVMAIDGEALRGSQGHQLPGVHLLAAYGLDVEAVAGSGP